LTLENRGGFGYWELDKSEVILRDLRGTENQDVERIEETGESPAKLVRIGDNQRVSADG
jgi:hypothetical protein